MNKNPFDETFDAQNELTRQTRTLSVRIPEPKFELPLSKANPAKWTHQRLIEYINTFEKELDDEHESGARLVSFGAGVVFHIQDIGYHGPDIITFYGKNEYGEIVQLIQHVSQLSVLLVAVKKLEEKPIRLGFLYDQLPQKTE